jgi:hypothetical protein
MKIITKFGIKAFEEKYHAKHAFGGIHSYRLRFYIEDAINVKRAINDMRMKHIQYELYENMVTLTQEDLSKLLPKEFFEEKRVWFGGDKMHLCCEMQHQHLSNTVNLLEILLKKGKISQTKAQDYMKKLEESILPELQERFNGEILPYKIHYKWEEDLLKLPDVF